MRFLRKAAVPFSILLGIGLAITISPLLALATDDSSTNSEITITVILAVAIAVGISVLLIAAYTTFRAGYSRRRRLPAMLAIWVLGQAELASGTET